MTDIQALIAKELKPGDPQERIEAFFQRHGMPFSFDAHQQRYQSYDPKSKRKRWFWYKSAVQILIYVNEDRSFQKAEVTEVFNA